MTTQLKETDPSEFTQHTMTEQEILAHPDFIAAKDVFEHRSLKPSQAMEISFRRDQWSLKSIDIFLGCLTPFAEGCGYSLKTEADDDAEYLIFTNTRPDSDSEFNLMSLPEKEIRKFAVQASEMDSDSELEKEYRFYSDSLAKLSQVQDGEGKVIAEKTKAMVESILAVAYRRGLPWAVTEMHKTAALGQA